MLTCGVSGMNTEFFLWLLACVERHTELIDIWDEHVLTCKRVRNKE